MTVSKTVALPLGYTPKSVNRIVYGKLFFSRVFNVILDFILRSGLYEGTYNSTQRNTPDRYIFRLILKLAECTASAVLIKYKNACLVI